MAKFKYLLANVCLALLILIGGMMVGIGLFTVPAAPHFLLDVVLTREELADVQKRVETLAMLEKIPRTGSKVAASGALIMALSAVAGWAIAVPGGRTDRQD